jgi:predicted glycosyltransferase
LSLERPEKKQFSCTVSIPWAGEHTEHFLEVLAEALARIGGSFGPCRIFLGDSIPGFLRERLNRIEFCSVESFGSAYLGALCESRTGMIFGGYNSLVDILSTGVPALVVLREMQDQEQSLHVEALVSGGRGLSTIEERRCTVAGLYGKLTALLEQDRKAHNVRNVNLDGAEYAAHALVKRL